MALDVEEEINLRQIIRQIGESTSYGGQSPIVWNFRTGARDQVRGALQIAQQIAAGEGYETPPVYDLELIDNPTTAYSMLRTAIRRSTQIFPTSVGETLEPVSEIRFDPTPMEFPTEEVTADLEEDF